MPTTVKDHSRKAEVEGLAATVRGLNEWVARHQEFRRLISIAFNNAPV